MNQWRRFVKIARDNAGKDISGLCQFLVRMSPCTETHMDASCNDNDDNDDINEEEEVAFYTYKKDEGMRSVPVYRTENQGYTFRHDEASKGPEETATPEQVENALSDIVAGIDTFHKGRVEKALNTARIKHTLKLRIFDMLSRLVRSFSEEDFPGVLGAIYDVFDRSLGICEAHAYGVSSGEGAELEAKVLGVVGLVVEKAQAALAHEEQPANAARLWGPMLEVLHVMTEIRNFGFIRACKAVPTLVRAMATVAAESRAVFISCWHLIVHLADACFSCEERERRTEKKTNGETAKQKGKEGERESLGREIVAALGETLGGFLRKRLTETATLKPAHFALTGQSVIALAAPLLYLEKRYPGRAGALAREAVPPEALFELLYMKVPVMPPTIALIRLLRGALRRVAPSGAVYRVPGRDNGRVHVVDFALEHIGGLLLKPTHPAFEGYPKYLVIESPNSDVSVAMELVMLLRSLFGVPAWRAYLSQHFAQILIAARQSVLELFAPCARPRGLLKPEAQSYVPGPKQLREFLVMDAVLVVLGGIRDYPHLGGRVEPNFVGWRLLSAPGAAIFSKDEPVPAGVRVPQPQNPGDAVYSVPPTCVCAEPEFEAPVLLEAGGGASLFELLASFAGTPVDPSWADTAMGLLRSSLAVHAGAVTAHMAASPAVAPALSQSIVADGCLARLVPRLVKNGVVPHLPRSTAEMCPTILATRLDARTKGAPYQRIVTLTGSACLFDSSGVITGEGTTATLFPPGYRLLPDSAVSAPAVLFEDDARKEYRPRVDQDDERDDEDVFFSYNADADDDADESGSDSEDDLFDSGDSWEERSGRDRMLDAFTEVLSRRRRGNNRSNNGPSLEFGDDDEELDIIPGADFAVNGEYDSYGEDDDDDDDVDGNDARCEDNEDGTTPDEESLEGKDRLFRIAALTAENVKGHIITIFRGPGEGFPELKAMSDSIADLGGVGLLVIVEDRKKKHESEGEDRDGNKGIGITELWEAGRATPVRIPICFVTSSSKTAVFFARSLADLAVMVRTAEKYSEPLDNVIGTCFENLYDEPEVMLKSGDFKLILANKKKKKKDGDCSTLPHAGLPERIAAEKSVLTAGLHDSAKGAAKDVGCATVPSRCYPNAHSDGVIAATEDHFAGVFTPRTIVNTYMPSVVEVTTRFCDAVGQYYVEKAILSVIDKTRSTDITAYGGAASLAAFCFGFLSVPFNPAKLMCRGHMYEPHPSEEELAASRIARVLLDQPENHKKMEPIPQKPPKADELSDERAGGKGEGKGKGKKGKKKKGAAEGNSTDGGDGTKGTDILSSNFFIFILSHYYYFAILGITFKRALILYALSVSKGVENVNPLKSNSKLVGSLNLLRYVLLPSFTYLETCKPQSITIHLIIIITKIHLYPQIHYNFFNHSISKYISNLQIYYNLFNISNSKIHFLGEVLSIQKALNKLLSSATEIPWLYEWYSRLSTELLLKAGQMIGRPQLRMYESLWMFKACKDPGPASLELNYTSKVLMNGFAKSTPEFATSEDYESLLAIVDLLENGITTRNSSFLEVKKEK